jgi:organic hydroperoxide reductase OsmC/OhrA
MHPFPHRYAVSALAVPAGVVTLRSRELEDIQSSAPPEFGGPEGNWSPETLLVAAVADCFVLSFRAIASASRLEWLEIDCGGEGVLEKTDTGTRFTHINLEVRLRVPPGADVARAERLLEKAEKACLVSNSLNSEVHLTLHVSA